MMRTLPSIKIRFLFAGFAMLAALVPAKAAHAQFCSAGPYACIRSLDIQTWWEQQQFTPAQQNFLLNDIYQNRIVNELWRNNMYPALQGMTSQIIATQTQMKGATGAMMDAAAASGTQLSMQNMTAQALRDYTPGEALCRFGTGVRSLAYAQESETATRMALNKIAEDRLLNKSGGQSSGGSSQDNAARFDQFRRLYCNPGDNNGQMKALCYPNESTPQSQGERLNKDIDIARTLEGPMTLNLNFANGDLSSDEEDLIALSSNLFGSDTFNHVPVSAMAKTPDDANRAAYLDLRQIAALRSVAQNSFNAIAAARAIGSGASAPYLNGVLQEMGMSEQEATQYLSGGTGNPSYYAQMEILTKKLYQNPNFYANLIDKPANIRRQMASMKGIELMQERDVFESLQRQEMLMSLLLELEVRKEARRISNNGQ